MFILDKIGVLDVISGKTLCYIKVFSRDYKFFCIWWWQRLFF